MAMRTLSCSVLAVTIFSALTQSNVPSSSQNNDRLISFSDNQCVAKGGIGIINRSLYIVSRSNKNELKLRDGKEWTGHSAEAPEVVTVFKEEVFAGSAVPVAFDLSHAAVISFERDKVRFFEFEKMSGGYYVRQKVE